MFRVIDVQLLTKRRILLQENGMYAGIYESQAFSSESVCFPDCDSICSVEMIGTDYFVVTIDGLYEEFSDITWKVYRVDSLKNKELLFTATFERDSSLVKVINSEKLIQINGSELRVSDIDGNNPVLINAELPGVNTVETECIDNLLYIGMQGRVIVYDLEGNLINTIDDDFLKTIDRYILGLNEFRLFDSKCEDEMIYIGYPGSRDPFILLCRNVLWQYLLLLKNRKFVGNSYPFFFQMIFRDLCYTVSTRDFL